MYQWTTAWMWSSMSLFHTLTNRWVISSMNIYFSTRIAYGSWYILLYLCIDNTACKNTTNKMNENHTSNCTDTCWEQSSVDPIRYVLITIVYIAALTVVLGIVILCWIGTYWIMKKKIRVTVLQTTVATAMPATGNRWARTSMHVHVYGALQLIY